LLQSAELWCSSPGFWGSIATPQIRYYDFDL
jgi:hypothetical protein